MEIKEDVVLESTKVQKGKITSVAIEEAYARLGDFKLQDINLRFKSGEFFVILGPSGAGKTVLLDLIAGFVFPKQGRVLLDELDVPTCRPKSGASEFAITAPEPSAEDILQNKGKGMRPYEVMTTVYVVLFAVWLAGPMLLNVITLVPCFVPWKVNRSVPPVPAIVVLEVLAPLTNARLTNVMEELSKVGCQS